MGAGLWSGVELEAYPQNVNTNSKPSDLKITDMRVATLRGVPMTSPIIRIDTNQGIYGLGEVRDGVTKNYALELKSRILNENPCQVAHLSSQHDERLAVHQEGELVSRFDESWNGLALGKSQPCDRGQ